MSFSRTLPVIRNRIFVRALGAMLLAIGLAPLAGAGPAAADTSDFEFDSFDSEYTLSRADDGRSELTVVETIVARFPAADQNRGIIRAIPNDYDGVDLQTVIESVVDETGIPVPYEQSDSGGFVELALGTDEFVHGAVTYVISYRQSDVVRSFADTASDEFYWDVNGTGWEQPFGRVSATLTVQGEPAASLTGNAACYVGAQGENTACPIQVPPYLTNTDDPSASPAPPPTAATFAAAAEDLAPGKTLTISVGFAADTFVTPEPGEPEVFTPLAIPLENHLLSGGLGLLSLGVLAAAIVGRVRAGRGARGRGTIIPQYSEPKTITILQAAHLVGRASAAIPAAIVRLAVRRNLRIISYPVYETTEPYSLQYLGSAGVNAEDTELLRLLFGSAPEVGAIRPFGQSDQELMRSLTALSSRAKDSLVPTGLQRRATGRGLAVALVVAQLLLGVLTLVFLALTLGAFYAVSGWLGVSMVVGSAALIATIALAVRPLQLTERGAEDRDYLFGMRTYLTLAEQDRLRMLQSPEGAERVDVGDDLAMVKLYEKLLPWAVLWGVEDEWMKELAVRVEALPEQPDWFVGQSGFNAILFAQTVRGLSSAMTPPASSWSGSGGGSFGGGSFGGGFSGGGGGGGGGGGR